MSRTRRTFSAEFKAKVALEALKGEEPIQAIAARHELLAVQVSQWKKEAQDRMAEVFAKPGGKDAREQIAEAEKEKELFARIGQQQVEIDFLKKKLRLWS
jgi:transposase